MDVLKSRLINRGTESEESLKIRLKNAVDEIEFCLKNENSLVGYKIINNDIEIAKKLFISIIEGLYFQELKDTD